MPTVPRASDIARITPSGQQRVSVSGGQGAISQAVTGLTGQVSAAAVEYAQRKDRYEYSQAKNHFLKGKVEQDNAYDDDQDYATVEDRYKTSMQVYLEDAAQVIESPKSRAAFMDEADLLLAQGIERIQGVAKGTEKDHQRAFITDSLSNLREAALTGDVPTSLDTADELIASAVEMGYMSAEEGNDHLNRWRDDMLVAKLEVMAPAERLEALREPWAANIPTDLKVRLERQAKSEKTKSDAIRMVDSFNLQDLSYGESLTEIAKIEDPALRQEAEQRLEVNRQQRQTAKAEEEQQMYQAYFAPIRAGELTITDIPTEEMARIEETVSPQMLNNLYAAERQAVSNQDIESDREVLETLNQLYDGGHGDPRAVLQYFNENSSKLSRTDHRTWAGVTPSDFTNLESDRVFTGKQQIHNKMMEVFGYENTKIRNERSAKYEREFEQFIFEYRNANEGADPSGEEQRQYIDRLFLELPTRESRVPFDTSPAGFKVWAEMDPNEKGKTLQYLESQDPASFAEARRIAGPNPDPDDIAYLFSIMSDVDNAAR